MTWMIRRLRAHISKSRRDERGFTLPELSVGLTVTLVIAAAAMAFIAVTTRQYEDQGGRVEATDDARNALRGMAGEIRDATLVTLVNARTVDATVWTAAGTLQNVRYACASVPGGMSSCTRTVVGSGQPRTIVSDVTNVNNFDKVLGSDLTGTTSEGGALRMRVDVDIPEASNPLSLESTVKPRNCVASPGTGVLNPRC